MTSGAIPLCSTAQKAPVLPTPVSVSSTIRGTDRLAVARRISRIQASGAGSTPASPRTGSRTVPAGRAAPGAGSPVEGRDPWPVSVEVSTPVRPMTAPAGAAAMARAVATGSFPAGSQKRTRARPARPGGSVRVSSATKASSTGVVRSMTWRGAPASRISRIARRTTGWLCPRASAPAPQTQSR